MTQLPYEFIKRIAQSLQEEEEDMYLLTLYNINSVDMEYFQESDRPRIRAIFKILMDDTRRHAELLRLIIEMAEQ